MTDKIRVKIKEIPVNLVIYVAVAFLILFSSLAQKDAEFSELEGRRLEYFHWPDVESVISGEWFDTFETYNLDQVIDRTDLIEANSRGLVRLGKRWINDVAISDDGILLKEPYDFQKPADLDNDYVKSYLTAYNEAADSYGGQFYFMNIYRRDLHFWDKYPYHCDEKIEDYLDQNRRNLQMMSEMGIRTVDTYDSMRAHADEYLFFLTDHHYTYRGAYYSYKTLLDTINANNPGRPQLCFPDIDEIRMTVPDGHFWGSLILTLGDTEFEGVDHLEYGFPDDYPKEYERFESGEKVDLSEMPLIRSDKAVEYGWFMNGDYGNTVIRTHRDELPSILIIGYSFTDALELMAIYNFNEMHSIDPRMFEGDIAEYIRNSKCDYVVLQDEITPE